MSNIQQATLPEELKQALEKLMSGYNSDMQSLILSHAKQIVKETKKVERQIVRETKKAEREVAVEYVKNLISKIQPKVPKQRTPRQGNVKPRAKKTNGLQILVNENKPRKVKQPKKEKKIPIISNIIEITQSPKDQERRVEMIPSVNEYISLEKSEDQEFEIEEPVQVQEMVTPINEYISLEKSEDQEFEVTIPSHRNVQPLKVSISFDQNCYQDGVLEEKAVQIAGMLQDEIQQEFKFNQGFQLMTSLFNNPSASQKKETSGISKMREKMNRQKFLNGKLRK